jgi:superfamily II DNA or RNA helicase
MIATVRNRRGIVAAVQPFDGGEGRLHLVHVEYSDDHWPPDEQVLWEREASRFDGRSSATLLEPNALPRAAASDPMPAADFDALLRSARWTAVTPYLDPDAEGPLERLPISSPFHGALQVEDYQLVPLLKALRMPRVSLLIADDVGLGKTIEAGLILSELLIRRRIQRVLILTPASLRLQWRDDELRDKFSLHFEIVDRDATWKLKRQLGIDANPWRSFPRIVASYHYLRQPDVLEEFRSACRTPEGSPHLPWDLLIVDEAHNLMPAPFGDDSDLCEMLRAISPHFEHRLFLTATPHNGHTRSFTGLLEMLDPVRFSRGDEMSEAEKARVEQVVVRRLKSEINRRTDPPPFCTRQPPEPVLLRPAPAEIALTRAFDAFRARVRSIIATGAQRRRRAGSFAIEILGKRLLSCPVAFAESWSRCKEGLAETRALDDADVTATERDVRDDTADDREMQSRQANASTVVGAWLKTIAGSLAGEIDAIDRALAALGLDRDGDSVADLDPAADCRFDALCRLIDDLLRAPAPAGGAATTAATGTATGTAKATGTGTATWKDDERLVVFTEYKTTLDYVLRRLRARCGEDDRILCLYGGMDDDQREAIKAAFNDPAEPVRVLVATDAAAEGLNLQATARELLHYDCPWNPSRLEQRNGRLDRHGQARDVTVRHFLSDQDQDLRFLDHVIRKVHQIREDLGSFGELFDEATHRRLIDGDDAEHVRSDLDRRIEAARGRAAVAADKTVTIAEPGARAASDEIAAMADELDLDPLALRDTLEAAMAIHAGRPQLECSESEKRCRILRTDLPGWKEVIDEYLRRHAMRGAVPYVTFSVQPFIHRVGRRAIFRPRNDTAMMHLAHPLIQRALGVLSRRRFPGAEEASRWTLRLGPVPAGADALVLLSLEELTVNDLRETFHHWVRTVCLPVRRGALGDPLPHQAARSLRGAAETHDPALRERARALLDDLEPDLRRFIDRSAARLTEQLRGQLAIDLEGARKLETDRYQSRQGEVSALIAQNTLGKLEREIERLRRDRDQGLLFEGEGSLDDLDRSIEARERELVRRQSHYEELRAQLARERDRILSHVLPSRYALRGAAQVFPLTIELRLPQRGGGAS